MRLLVAITDSDWFDHLAELRPDEVNFWKPSGAESFHSLSPGEPFLFKLHSPHNFIVGGGFFSHYTLCSEQEGRRQNPQCSVRHTKNSA